MRTLRLFLILSQLALAGLVAVPFSKAQSIQAIDNTPIQAMAVGNPMLNTMDVIKHVNLYRMERKNNIEFTKFYSRKNEMNDIVQDLEDRHKTYGW